MFIGYADKSVAYRFIVIKSDVLDNNTIIETKNAEFFENIFHLKMKEISNSDVIPVTPVIENDFQNEVLRKSKRPRKEKSFGDDFYTYLVENDPVSFSDAISSSEAQFWQ